MSMTYSQIKKYITQWVKDRSGKRLDGPLLDSMINRVLVDVYSATNLRKVETTVSLTTDQGTYAISDVISGTIEMMRPLYLFIDNVQVPDYDFEKMEYLGYREGTVVDSENQMDTKLCQNWELGDLRLYPAASVDDDMVCKLIYAGYPTTMSDSSTTFDTHWRPQWEEILCWGVLYRLIASNDQKQQQENMVVHSDQDARREYYERLKAVAKDATYESARVYTWKERGGKRLDAKRRANFSYR